jgi:hypothetical protein
MYVRAYLLHSQSNERASICNLELTRPDGSIQGDAQMAHRRRSESNGK